VTETRVMASESMEITTKVVVGKVVRITAILVAIFVALPFAGIDVTTLSIFSGALGVGLGFGLQKIASNYVSGFIVLLDRSLRIGDVVTVDGRKGEVKAIESRYTVIRGLDGVESIVPNETLITQTVSHHTYSDPKVSVVIAVSVAYESDVAKACEVLLEVAKRHKRVLDEPASAALVKEFGDNGIDLSLTVWIADPAVGEGRLRSDLLLDILASFKAHGIEIPYPRRDVRILATAETPGKPANSRI
ncbi:MAG TPA: mechanosensitive ion channel domain-containing protein, partial [Usitatibacter sp.]|nr:mechanosensitive ion channel domain-containing protein [Usitatibacter sp.]